MACDSVVVISYDDCGIKEEIFPCLGKCYRKNDAVFMASYESICSYCNISESLIHGVILREVTIFECEKLGYGKRTSE